MKGWNKSITISSGLLALSGCGPKEPPQKGFLPSNSYQNVAEEIPVWTACANTENYGCANLRASGETVHGLFEFKNIFSSCTTSSSQSDIEITNNIVTSPTLRVRIALRKNLIGSYNCANESNSDCDVEINIHSVTAFSNSSQICEISIVSTNPLMGKIACPQLITPLGSFGILHGSTFSCSY